MRVLTLRGSHYGMGVQHGQQVLDLRPQIVAAMDTRLQALDRREDVDGIVKEVERAWLGLAHSTLEMLHGIADALAIPFARLFRYALASYLDDLLLGDSKLGIPFDCAQGMASHKLLAMTDEQRPKTEACTVWAAAGSATRDGAPILTKNRDYALAHLPLQMLADATPQSGYRYLYVTSAGSPAVFSSGMNEKGLVVADTHVASRNIGPGIARYTLMLDLLEQHATVMTALTYLQLVSHMGAGNLIVADAHGDLVVCESGYTQCGFVAATKSMVVATNHFVSDALRDDYVERARGARRESQARYQTAQAALRDADGALDAAYARRLMARHAGRGAAICRHDSGDDAGTISNVIFLPAERKLLFCNGRPCEGVYVTCSL